MLKKIIFVLAGFVLVNSPVQSQEVISVTAKECINCKVVEFTISSASNPEKCNESENYRIEKTFLSKKGVHEASVDCRTKKCRVVVDNKMSRKDFNEILNFIGLKTDKFIFPGN